MRMIAILFKCFRLSTKAWLHSDYFKRCGFYAIAAALCSLLTSGVNFFLFHDWIFGILFFAFAIFNIFINWFIWFGEIYREHYGDEENES